MSFDLEVESLVRDFAAFRAVDNVSFQVERGSFFSILGPSGCGKTTLLRMIAGFLEPTSGDIRIRGDSVLGVPPNLRPVNLIFQHLSLFPMMDVKENIAFGLKRRKTPPAEIQRKVTSILERVGLPEQADKKIGQLSGGQKQRVAIARALVLEPSILLLDEPLGALDLKLREQMKIELKKLQQQVGTTFVYITHDQSEALVMSDQVAVMHKGSFEQIDTPKNLYAHPKSGFVANFIGENNVFDAHVQSGDPFRVSINGDLEFDARAMTDLRADSDCQLYIRPESIVINPESGDGINRFSITVKNVLFDGANTKLLATIGNSGNEIMAALPQDKRFDNIQAGDQLDVGVYQDACTCF
jgi:spermidine/putrescine transport system ATP-binding protein